MTRRWLFLLPLSMVLDAGPAGAQEGEAAPAAARGWSLTMDASESWESDPLFQSVNEPASFATRVGGGVTYQGAGRRGNFTIGGQGGGFFYHNLPGNNSYYYGAAFSLLRRFSPKTTFTLTESLTNDYAQKSDILVSGGLLYPLVRTLGSRTTAGLIHGLSGRTRLELAGEFNYVNFLTGDYVDGQQLGAGMTISRQLAGRASLGLGYYFTKTTNEAENDEQYHSLRLVWAQGLGRNTSFNASFGATGQRQLDGSLKLAPTGGAGFLLANPRTKLNLSLRYEHAVSQAFGLGVDRIADLVSFTLTRPVGRKTAFTTGYGYSLSKDTAIGGVPFRYATQNANAGARYSPNRTLSLDLSYSYFRSEYYTPTVNNHVFLLGLALRRDAR